MRKGRRLGVISLDFGTLADIILGRRCFISTCRTTGRSTPFPEDTQIDHVIVDDKREIVEFVVSAADSGSVPLFELCGTQEPPQVDVEFEDLMSADEKSLKLYLQNPTTRSELLDLAKKILYHAL